MDKGGCVLVLMTEGGELKQNTNINFLLEEFGIMVNNGKYSGVQRREGLRGGEDERRGFTGEGLGSCFCFVHAI